MKRTFIALGCAALSLTACTSAGPEPVEGAALTGDAAALPELEVVSWSSAIASCEGVIDGSESYAVTRPEGLVVALGPEGAICVDTLPALEEELGALGLERHAEDLAQRYFTTLDAHPLAQSTSGTADGPTAGEPNPQPSLEAITAVTLRTPIAPNEGEPNPQPSGPAGGEPNPQPSGENKDGSSDPPPDDGSTPPPPMPRI